MAPGAFEAGPRLVAGRAHPALAEAVATGLRVRPVPAQVERFPDGELRPTVGCVRDCDVYVLAPTGPPVNDNLVELLLLLDACRRGGAARLTAVVAYLGYARQDRRSRDGQALGLRTVADVIVEHAGDDAAGPIKPARGTRDRGRTTPVHPPAFRNRSIHARVGPRRHSDNHPSVPTASPRRRLRRQPPSLPRTPPSGPNPARQGLDQPAPRDHRDPGGATNESGRPLRVKVT